MRHCALRRDALWVLAKLVDALFVRDEGGLVVRRVLRRRPRCKPGHERLVGFQH